MQAPTFVKQGAGMTVRTIVEVTLFVYFFKKVGRE